MTTTIGKLFLILAIATVTFTQTPSQQPIIGVYTQDCEEFHPFNTSKYNKQLFSTYIASSYVKNLEMAGAQVVPLFYHYSQSQMLDLLGKINGAFFPGGGMFINDPIWARSTKVIVDYARRQYDNGRIFPIWGTCLGYYSVMFACTDGETDAFKFLSRVQGQLGLVHSLIVKDNDSKILKSLSAAQFNDATTGNGIFFFWHNWSIKPETLSKYPSWVDMFKIIATSKTNNGVEFMSVLQGKKYPIYLTQFHAQKNPFEWRTNAKRSYNAISAAQKLANFFVNEARKNKNVFPYDEMKKKLIYNYNTTLLGLDQYWTQVYIFDESKLVQEETEEGDRRNKASANVGVMSD